MNETLEVRIARLEDAEAIKAVKWRYLRACDRKQPAAARACMTDDAVLDYEGFPPFTSPEMFVDLFTRFACVPHIIDMHHGIHPVIDLDGDTATATFDLYFFQIDTKQKKLTQLAVSYDDEFVRQNGQWLIRRSIARRISTLVRELDEEGYERVVAAGRSDTDEPAPPPRA